MDEQTLYDLYVRYGYAVHRRCSRILGSASDADDVLQEVFMRAMRYGSGFDGKNPLGWLYRISDRQCFDVLRKNKSARGFIERWGVEKEKSAPVGGEVERETISPARNIATRADPKDARVAVLYYVDGLTQDEVADEIPCSRKTVKKRLARFKDLARKLGAEVGIRRRDP